MITERTCYIVTCTGCGEQLDYGDYYPHFDSIVDARSLLEHNDWWTDGEIELCDPCRSKPHEFVPEVPSRDDVACERCGLDKDDHEPMTDAVGGA